MCLIEFVCGIAILSTQSSQVEAQESFNLCTSASTCDDCVNAAHACAWCGSPDYFYQRCNLHESQMSNGCPAKYVFNPENVVDVAKDIPVGSKPDGSAVNIQPQLVNLKLRPGSTEKFNVTVYVSKNYPVDLYYLVDNTVSMMDDFVNLATLSDQLIAEMVALTQNFHLGLGTFSDKPLKPWIMTDFYTKKPIALCDDCAIPDVFRHRLSLGNISNDEFAVKLKDVSFAATIEDTEASLEAMLQVVVCQDVIGWRKNSKRILLVSTESIAHFSGDGLFSGLLSQHDGNCYTNSEGVYSAAEHLDFPSVETLHYKLKESRIQTVFAIPDYRKDYYEELAKVLPMTIVAVMAEDSKDLVKVVVDSFTKIAKMVQLSFVDTQPDEKLAVNFTAYCPNGEVKPGSTMCEDVDFDSSVIFEVSVTAPLNRYFYSSFSLAQESLEHWSTLRVNVQSVTEGGCDCDDSVLYPPPNKLQGEVCSNHGDLVCGGCVCNSGFSGDHCQCAQDSPVNISLCQSPALGISLPCSDRGSCVCDGCKCAVPPLGPEITSSLKGTTPKVFGQFCQCDNWSCRKYNGLVCGGLERGVCEGCDTPGPSCVCKEGYEGKACECPVSTASCMAESSGKICNGQGECVCGQCRCFPNSRYRGDTCEQCFNCPNIHCEPSEECVVCAYKHRGEIRERQGKWEEEMRRWARENGTREGGVDHMDEEWSDDFAWRWNNSVWQVVQEHCLEECRNVAVVIVDEESEGEGREQCLAEDEDDCSYLFYYFPPTHNWPGNVTIGNREGVWEWDEDNLDSDLIIWNKKFGYPAHLARVEIVKKYCDDPLILILVILFIILGILLIGISLLVAWKIIVTIQDRREFAEFQSALKHADVKRNENPMFVKPTQTVNNPVHDHSSTSASGGRRRSLRLR